MDISGIPRYEAPNPYNYTDDQLADKALAMAKMKIIYPTVDAYYAEMVYDMCVNTKKEELDEIKKRVETNPFKYNYANLQEELNKVKERNDELLKEEKEKELISQTNELKIE